MNKIIPIFKDLDKHMIEFGFVIAMIVVMSIYYYWLEISTLDFFQIILHILLDTYYLNK